MEVKVSKLSLRWVILIVLSGCIGTRSHELLDILEEELGASLEEKQFVDGYLEYAGPPEKWAGFDTFILHIRARDRGNAEIVLTPSSFEKTQGQGELGNSSRHTSGNRDRKKGSRDLAQTGKEMKRTIASDVARERFATLAQAFEKNPRMQFSGCYYPVRVRLARRDGEILEMLGCRGQKGWVQKASQLVDEVLLSRL